MHDNEDAGVATRCLRKSGLNRSPFLRATQVPPEFLGGQEIHVAGVRGFTKSSGGTTANSRRLLAVDPANP